MSHGDDLGMAVVQMSTTVAQSSIQTVTNLIAEIIKMIQAANEHKIRSQEMELRAGEQKLKTEEMKLRNEEIKLKSGIDLSPLKAGEVKMKDLMDSARKNADTVSMSEHGISEADALKLTEKAKEYGIPVAFTRNEDSMKAHVRGRDLPVFKQMFTEMMQDKIKNNAQSLGNFKIQKWEIPYLTSELSNYNLNAQFGSTKSGQYFCMFDKEDEKAILLARGSFLQKYREVRDEFKCTKDEEGFCTLSDSKTGKKITFDNPQQLSCRDISLSLQNEFGYDKNKADLAAAKFGEEMLEGKFKKDYFENPANAAKAISTNIEFIDDDIYVQQYTCCRIVPKYNATQCIVFMDQEGRYATLDPDMTHSQMADALKSQLGLSDKKEINSLIEKAEKTMLYYDKEEQQKYNSDYKFYKEDFDMTDINTVSGMKREMDGHVYTRSLPLDELGIEIDRYGDAFGITTSAVHLEKNENDEITRSVEKRSMECYLSDKKKSVSEIETMLINIGVPPQDAGRIAYETFGKAESQERARITAVEGVRTETSEYYSADLKVEAEVYSHGKSGLIDVTDKENGLSQLKETFGVSEDKAGEMFDEISNKLTDKQKNKLESFGYECSEWSVEEASFVLGKISENGWNVPDDMQPSVFSIESIRNPICLNTEKVPVPELPDVIDDVDISIGGR